MRMLIYLQRYWRPIFFLSSCAAWILVVQLQGRGVLPRSLDENYGALGSLIISAGFAFWAFQAIFYGQAHYGIRVYSRHDQPRNFWWTVGLWLVVAAVCAFAGLSSLFAWTFY
jgi:hypothetical protein